MDTRVEHNAELNRYEIYVDDLLGGFVSYKPADSNRAFIHTEIYSRWEGMGLGKVLVSSALDDTREQGLGVLPFCPFVHRFITKNLDYLDLVPEWARDRLDLPGGVN